MQNREDDIFFQQLRNKLDELKGEHASEQDWQSFQLAYARNKSSHRKRRGLVWISSVSIILIMGWISTHIPQQSRKQLAVNEKDLTISSDALTPLRNEEQSVLSASKIPAPTMISSPAIISSSVPSTTQSVTTVPITTKRQLHQQPVVSDSNVPTSIPAQKKLAQSNELSDQTLGKPQTSQRNAIRRKAESRLKEPAALMSGITTLAPFPQKALALDLETPQKINAPEQTQYDSTKVKKSASETDDLGFVELNAIGSNSYAPLKVYPSDKYFIGAGINVGYRFKRNLYLLGGLNYSAMREINTIVIKSEYFKQDIVSIDTTLKMNLMDNKIAFQIDTIVQNKSYTSETSVKLSTDKSIIALPLAIQYRLGKNRFGISVQAGVTTLFLSETITTLDNVGLPTQKRTTSSRNSVAIAPAIGLGVYKSLYKNLNIHVDGNYMYLLPNSFTSQNLFQIQTGLSYHF